MHCHSLNTPKSVPDHVRLITWMYLAGELGWSMLHDVTYEDSSSLVSSDVETETSVWFITQKTDRDWNCH